MWCRHQGASRTGRQTSGRLRTASDRRQPDVRADLLAQKAGNAEQADKDKTDISGHPGPNASALGPLLYCPGSAPGAPEKANAWQHPPLPRVKNLVNGWEEKHVFPDSQRLCA